MPGATLLAESHSIEVAPETVARRRHVVLPVDLPPGVVELEVRLSVDGPGRIDLGVLDPRSADGSLAGFRGWSGSARESFVIQHRAATPGYLPGPIPAGRWQVMLGLYVVEDAVRLGVEVTARRSRTDHGDAIAERPEVVGGPPGADRLESARARVRSIAGIPASTPANPLAGEGWVRGDFHCHSVHSNDAETPMALEDAVAAAEAIGLEVLAITDHNTTSHWKPLRALARRTETILVRGVEVTTYAGHFNAFGPRSIVDFRYTDEASLRRAVDDAVSDGALLSVNHPKSFGPAWEYGLPEAFAAVEVWQAPWAWANGESMAFWDAALQSGRRMACIGGSDLHDLHVRPFHQLGTPTTWVRAPTRSARSVISGISRGETMVSASPHGPVVLFERLSSGGQWTHASGARIGARTPLRCRVVGRCDGTRLRVVGSGGVFRSLDLSGTDVVVELGSAMAGHSWMRPELWQDGIFSTGPVTSRMSQLKAVSGPAYLR